MARAGAKRRPGVSRYPKSGAIVRADRGERPEQIIAVALKQPHRNGNPSPLAGYSFGRMFLGGAIDRRQFDAAETYTRRAVRYMGAITSSLPSFKNPLADMVKRELEQQREQERIVPQDWSLRDAPHDDVERIAGIRSDYAEIQDALADAGMLFEANSILMRVCVMDWTLRKVEDMGAFRCALNVIANRLRM